MKDFKITAKSLSGHVVEEVISAETELDANRIASEKGLFVTKIKSVDDSAAAKKSLKTKDLIIFSQQMAAMLNAGTTTDKALNMVRMKAEGPKLKQVYSLVYEEVQKGEAMSHALRSAGVFPNLLVNMVSSGETTGNIGDIFKTMSIYYDKEAALNRKVKSAMVYPMVLAIMTVVIVVVLVTFVLPGIMSSFDGMEMPFLTRMLMGMSDFIISKWYLIIGVVLGGSFGLREALKRREFRIKFDKMKLKLPVMGSLLTTIYSARAARTISSLYANGASMLVVVQETGGTIGNKYIETLFDNIYVKVSTGERLSKAMGDTGVFDPMLPAMIEVGEEAGDIQEILANISEFFDNEADAATERMVGLLEPVFLIIMGIVVGVVIVAIMQPMMSMYDVV